MKQPELIETAPAEAVSAAPELPGIDHLPPYLPPQRKATSRLVENRRLVVIGIGVAVVMLLVAVSGLSPKSMEAAHDRNTQHPSSEPKTATDSAPPSSLTPIIEAEPSPSEGSPGNSVDAEQLARTATGRKDLSVPAGALPQSEDARLPEPSYIESSAVESSAASPGVASVPEGDTGQEKPGTLNSSSQPSLVFIAKQTSFALASSEPKHGGPELDLPPGTRLRARLEAAVNSAVRTPVVAIVEYNYEQNGDIVIPAGARVTGQLESAGRSGYVEIRFDSLSIPGIAPLRLEAIATDLGLRPLRGRVEGKSAGKNLLVRSAAGIAQIAATLAGRENLDQPLNESDLLRERLSNNIGQAADQKVAGLALTEQTVVALPAATEIYVVIEKLAFEKIPHEKAPSREGSQRNLDELRQLLELRRELEQAPEIPAP